MMGFINKLAHCFFLLLFFSIAGKAQQVPSYNFTTLDGLPNNSIRSVFVDSRGIVWIGTENGVSKLENERFQNFFEKDGLGFNSCWAIEEDSKGNLWFGSYGGGITVFDGRDFHVFTVDDGLADNRIRRFYPYQDKMLIGTEDGISIADIESYKITSISSSIRNNDLNYTSGFFEVGERLFYTTYRSGSYELILNDGNPRVNPINTWLPIFSIFMEGDQLFLSDKGSLKKIGLADFIHGKKPSETLGQSIVWNKLKGLNDESYAIAASTFSKDGGVFLFENGKMLDLGKRFGVNSRFILAGAVDQKRKLLYLGSQDKGLFQVRLDNIIMYEEFDETEVKGIAGDTYRLGILSKKGLEIRDYLDGKMVVPVHEFKRVQADYFRKFPQKIPKQEDGFFELDESIPSEEIEFYELHHEGSSWWTNTNIGIFHLSLQGEFLTYLPVHSYSIGFTTKGQLIETNPYAGVRIYSDPKNFKYTYFDPSHPNTPLQIAKVAKGDHRTYLASVFHGLYHWDGKNFFSYKNEGLWSEQKFKTLHYLGIGQLLVGTEFGDLYRIQANPEFRILKKWPKEELLGSSILFIEQFQDVIFVGSELGLHILKGDEFRFWSEEKGVFNRVFKTARRIGDKLYIGLDKGFYEINLPELIAKEYPPVELLITELKINSQFGRKEDFRWFVFQGDYLDLDANENSLTIRFQPKGSFNSGKLRYHYRIKPTAEWTEFSDEALIELPYLPSGSYHLEVEIQDLFSGKISQTSLLQFTIAKPFYLQWWFITLMILLLAALFLMIYKFRMNQIRSEASLKQRLIENKLEALQSQMNPHFTFNAINSIQYYILKNDTAQALAFLGKFSRLIRSTLNQSSMSQITLEEEINYLNQYIEVENIRMDNRVSWEIKGNALDRKKDLRIPPMIIQPLVENVFKHAFSVGHPNPELSIGYELLPENKLLCTVKDNGEGMNAKRSSLHKSKGIEMIREKLSLLPGYTENSVKVSFSKKGTEARVIIFCG
jgi:hypothetical protein